MIKSNKYEIVDLFSDGGGLELGFKQAGCDVVSSTNFNDTAKTYT